MAGVPYTFGTATTSIPLSQLDADFNTPVTIGSTTVGLGNTVTSLAGLSNVTTTNAIVTNLTLGGTQNQQIGQGNASTLKNRIINGAMVIDQRNAGASVTPANGTYTLDRWQTTQTTASKFSVQQNAGSVTPPVGFSNYLGVTSLSAYSVGASDIFSTLQGIEGYNIADLGWGTANAKTVTLSFWVRSSLTGTFGGALNSGTTRSYPFNYTISSANTWEQKSITVAGDTTGTWNTINNVGLQVWFNLGTGSTYSGTAGSWAAANYVSATGATSVVGTSGATFYITGVQLEVGSSATGFEYRQYTTELCLCQRYYSKTFPQNVAPANGLGTNYFLGYSPNSANPITIWKFPVTMRSSPTVTLFNDRSGGTAGQWNNGTLDSANARALGGSTEFVMLDNSAVGLTSNNWWLGGATAAIEL